MDIKIKENTLLKRFFLKEYSFKLVAALGFIISLILLIVSFKLFGSFYESNDDPRFVLAMKGLATPKPFDNFYYLYTLTVYAYIELYKLFPDVAWYGYSMFLLLLGTLFNVFITIYLFFKNKLSFLFIILIFITFYFLIFIQNVYLINFTRPSILSTASFVALLSALYLEGEILIKNRWILIFPSIIYILGHLTRVDGGYLGLVIGLCFSFCVILYKKNIFTYLVKFILPVLGFVAIIMIFNTYSYRSNLRNKDYFEKIGLVIKIVDNQNPLTYHPINIQDTVAHDALIKAMYWGDNEIITIDLFNRIIQGPYLFNNNFAKSKASITKFIRSMDEENKIAWNLNLAFILIMLAWFITSFKTHYKVFLKFILLQLFFIMLVLVMSYYMKLPERVFNPLLVLLTLFNVLILSSILSSNKIFLYLISITIFAILLLSIPGYLNANEKLIDRANLVGNINQRVVNDINSQFHNTILIPLTVRAWCIHDNSDPIREINFKNNNSFVYLSIDFSLAPETKDQLIAKFGTSNHSELFKRISCMNNVIFISNEPYNNFIRVYYYYLYNQNFTFEKVITSDDIFEKETGIGYYRLRSKI